MSDRNVRGNHWVVLIRGEPVALDQWRAALKSPFDPWIEIMKLGNDDPRHVIRSIEFGGATTAKAVRERALFMIDALNGTMNSLGSTDRVEFDGVLEVQPDGKLHHTLFSETAMSDDCLYTASMAGGKPGTPAPSPAQRWYKLGTADRVAADLLVHFGKEASWYELYKSYEGVRRLCGGKDKLLKKSWAPSKSDIERFTRTADYYHRHAYDPTKTPPNAPMLLKDAVEMIRRMVRAILVEKSPK